MGNSRQFVFKKYSCLFMYIHVYSCSKKNIIVFLNIFDKR